MSDSLDSKGDLRGALRALICGLVAFSAAAGGCREGREENAATKGKEMWVEIAGRRWHVRLAMTKEEQEKGLAGVEDLGEDEGMLFIFDRPQVQKFWMRGCLIPLDVAFIDAGGRIVKKYTMPVVQDGREPPGYGSGQPVLFALEVGAGSLEATGVRNWDTVTFSPEIWRVIKGRGMP